MNLETRVENLNSELHELKNDNANLEHELTKKQGQIEYLEQRADC